MLHGTYLIIHKLILNKFPKLKNNYFLSSRLGKIISILITQYFIFLAWIPFRVQETQSMLYAIEKYIFLDFQYTSFFGIVSQNKFAVGLIILFIILNFISYKYPNLIKNISNLKLVYWTIILIIIITSILFFFDGNPEDFIYFKF